MGHRHNCKLRWKPRLHHRKIGKSENRKIRACIRIHTQPVNTICTYRFFLNDFCDWPARERYIAYIFGSRPRCCLLLLRWLQRPSRRKWRLDTAVVDNEVRTWWNRVALLWQVHSHSVCNAGHNTLTSFPNQTMTLTGPSDRDFWKM